MKLKFFLLFFQLTTFYLYGESKWTHIKYEDFLPFDSSKNKNERLFAKQMSAYKDKIAFARIFEYKGIAIYENNQWSLLYLNDIKSKFQDDSLYIKLDFDWAGVISLDFDSKGILWGISSGGIFRFDGQKFTGYHKFYNESTNDSFEINQAHFIKIDNYDNPFALVLSERYSNTYHLCRFSQGRFILVYSFKYKKGSEGYQHKDFAIDNNQKVWQLVSDSLIIIESMRYIRSLCINDLFQEYGVLNNIRNFKNKIYLLTNWLAFYIHDDSTWISDKSYYNIVKAEFPENNEGYPSTFMCVDSNDNCWMIYITSKQLCRRSSDGRWTAYKIPAITDSLPQWYVMTMEADYKGRISISTGNHGIFILDPNLTDFNEEINIEPGLLPDVWLRKLYPNPTTEIVTLEFFLERGFTNSIKISLYNSMGMKVKDLNDYLQYNGTNYKAVVMFPVSELTDGIYYITVSAGNSNAVKGFIKLKK